MSRATREARTRAEPVFVPALHLAVVALGGRCPGASVRAVETIKHDHGSEVYRLRLDGPGPPTLIAKRQPAGRIDVERVVYEEILPRALVASLRSYGTLTEDDSARRWIFLEDAADTLPTPSSLAGVTPWFAALHLATARMEPPPSLPRRGVQYYAERLERACALLVAARGNPAITIAEAAPLEDAIAALGRAAARWETIAGVARRMPATLVHGDLARKNVVRSMQTDRPLLQPIDWGFAAWGVAAEDLAFLDADTYAEAVAGEWGWSRGEARAVAGAGKVFRAIVCFDWDAAGAGSPWPMRVLRKLASYRALLDRGLDALDRGT